MRIVVAVRRDVAEPEALRKRAQQRAVHQDGRQHTRRRVRSCEGAGAGSRVRACMCGWLRWNRLGKREDQQQRHAPTACVDDSRGVQQRAQTARLALHHVRAACRLRQPRTQLGPACSQRTHSVEQLAQRQPQRRPCGVGARGNRVRKMGGVGGRPLARDCTANGCGAAGQGKVAHEQ